LADVHNPDALANLLRIKPRGSDKGQPLVAPNIGCWQTLVEPPSALARRLAERFWPGPLTLVTAARENLDARLTLNGNVAVRVPGPSIAADIVALHGAALTATSANDPGAPPCLSSDEVASVFQTALARGQLVVVAGTAPGGAPSTLVQLDCVPGGTAALLGGTVGGGFRVIREGAISSAALRQVLSTESTEP
jgi:tRNA A37 threonylcarbamoyladenosine synthetase subunit TsaC/SUA5/YrdC